MSRTKQRSAIREVLESADGAWVSLPDIYSALGPGTFISQHNARIWELRHDDGLDIRNRTERVDGTKHSWYRLVSESQGELGI